MSFTPKVSMLSSKDLNKTLSAKKRPMKTVKNLLWQRDHWLELTDEWTLFNKMEYLGFGQGTENVDCLRNHMVFGVKQVSRYIRKEACAAVITDKGAPRMLISHVMYEAQEKNIPAIQSKSLSSFLFNMLGFKCSVVCFKPLENTFPELMNIITNSIQNLSVIQQHKPTNTTPQTNFNESAEPETMDSCSKPIYLKRPSDGKRAFNPPPSSKGNVEPKSKSDTKVQYIKLDTGKETRKDKRKTFQHLYIKRIHNDVHRKSNKQN